MVHWRIKTTLLSLFICAASNCFATQAKGQFTLTPLNDPLLHIPLGETRELNYRLVNHDSKMYQLQMMPVDGVTQQAGRGLCDALIQLNPGQSCILSLSVDNLSHNTANTAPLLCEDADDWQRKPSMRMALCVQPEAGSEMRIKTGPGDRATLSITVALPQALHRGQEKLDVRHCFASFAQCSLALFQGTGTQGYLTIKNTSNVTAWGIQALNLPNGVTQDASECGVLAPGHTCYLKFIPGSIKTAGETVIIAGMNTVKSSIIMQVLGIGDPYNGNLLVQLPTAATQYNYYTTSVADVSNTPLSWDATNPLCTGTSMLAEPAQLTLLSQASTCNGGPIGGFVCATPDYWGAELNAASAYTVDIATGTIGSLFKNIPAPRARCVQKYQLIPV